MKKILLIAVASIVMLSLSNCKFVDTNTVGGKTVITSSNMSPQVFGALEGASVGVCLGDLNSNGVTQVNNAGGSPKGAVSSGSESCQATGTK